VGDLFYKIYFLNSKSFSFYTREDYIIQFFAGLSLQNVKNSHPKGKLFFLEGGGQNCYFLNLPANVSTHIVKLKVYVMVVVN
jgi:hypothetical protein